MNIEVAVPTPLAQTFTYETDKDIPPGSRVLVPFGRRRVVGVVLGPSPGRIEHDFEIKPIEKVIDESPVYNATVLEIARWISAYYLHPIGEVLRTMLPASSSQTVKETYELTDEGDTLIRQRDLLGERAPAGELLALLFKRKSSLTGVTVRKRLVALQRDHGRWHDLTLRELVKKGWVRRVRGKAIKARKVAQAHSCEPLAEAPNAEVVPELTTLQTRVLETLCKDGLEASRPPVFLLHGVTGAGKTEVYLRLIAACLRQSLGEGQSLVLVPEISLTPQMTQVFERRFPGQVAVVHSAMTDAERWSQLERVRRGQAVVLIGPRSAVFGPFKCLKLLIVDEEHDSSYKQTNGLTYHGRDVAVLRGRLERATVILGSATPSMESYQNAITGKYRLLEMHERIGGRRLPEVELIASEVGSRRTGTLILPSASDGGDGGEAVEDIPIDDRVIAALKANIERGEQAIVLVNRRGYAYYLFSLEERQPVQCPRCTISLTLHARSKVLRCHYCDYSTTIGKVMSERPGETLVAVGYGSEKAERYLKRRLPGARIARLDSDTVVHRDVLPQTLAAFRRGDVDLLVGTQILAKGHDFPKVTLIVILEVDQLLGLPDFRAGERTFQLLVQAAGRAGRADLPGRVLIQSLRSEHPVVTAAIRHDYKSFAERELRFRRRYGYPPFSRMIAIELNSMDRKRLMTLSERIEKWIDRIFELQRDLAETVQVLGPSIPPIETIRGRHRRGVIFLSSNQGKLRRFVTQFLTVFENPQGDVRVKVDVDPQSLI